MKKGEFQKRLEKVRAEQKELEKKEEAYLLSLGLFVPDVTFIGYTPDYVEELKKISFSGDKPIKSKWTVGKTEKDGTFKREDLLIYYHVST